MHEALAQCLPANQHYSSFSPRSFVSNAPHPSVQWPFHGPLGSCQPSCSCLVIYLRLRLANHGSPSPTTTVSVGADRRTTLFLCSNDTSLQYLGENYTTFDIEYAECVIFLFPSVPRQREQLPLCSASADSPAWNPIPPPLPPIHPADTSHRSLESRPG